MTSQEARLLATAQEVIRPSFTGDVVQWVEDNVLDVPDSMIRGKLSLKRTPWLAEALRILTDPETKLGVVIAAIRQIPAAKAVCPVADCECTSTLYDAAAHRS